MKCKRCGEELPERARFCPACGMPVEEVPAPRKLEEPLEPMGLGAVPLVPIAPPPRASRISPRVPRSYGATRAGRSSARIPLSAYPTLSFESGEKDAKAAASASEGESVEEKVVEVAEAAEPKAEKTVEVEGVVAEAEVPGPKPAETALAEPEIEPEPEESPVPESWTRDDAPTATEDEPAAADLEDEPGAAAEPEPAAAEPSPAPEPTIEEPEPAAEEPELEKTVAFEAVPEPQPEPAAAPEPQPAPEEPAPEPAEPQPSLFDRARASVSGQAHRAADAFHTSNDQRALIGIGALAAVVAVAFLVYVSLGWFGPFADRSYVAPEVQPPSDGSIEPLQPQEDEEPELAIEGGPEVRSSYPEYSWAELSQISALISAAESDETGIQIAAHYNLCGADGTIGVDSTKSLELSTGASVPIAIAGFRHDTRSDGTGLAGISFVARGSVGTEPMNALAQTTGGWEGSTLRAWVNEGLLAQLPAELADLLVPVDKTTNPVAGSGTTAQSVTSDRVWLLSYSEIVGEVPAGNKRYGIYQPEGEQYSLFAQLGVTGAESAPQVALASGEYWWERSPEQTNSTWFMCVSPDGDTGYGHRPATPDAVVIGFCL